MKKTIRLKKFKVQLLFTFLAVFLMTACSSNETVDIEDVEEYAEITDEVETGAHGLPLIHLTEEARDIVLEDFDYLAYEILQNAATRGVFYRRFEITLEEYLEILREHIEDMEPVQTVATILLGEHWEEMPTDDPLYLAAEYLTSLLFWALTIDTGNLGHFGPQIRELYIEMFHGNSVIFDDPERAEFTGDIRNTERLLSYFNEPATLRLYNVDPSEFDLTLDLSDMGLEIENNVTTQIIEADRIAYVSIESFVNSPSFDNEILFPFFEEVQDFEHLIIDIRGNGGGWPHYVTDSIVGMLIEESLEFRFVEAFAGGERALRTLEYTLLENILGATSEDMMPIRGFMEENELIYFNDDDLEFLQYVSSFHLLIEPDENSIPFAGEIWLLIDGSSGSASEFLALLSIYSGFATVVGEPSAGVTGVATTFVSLPNTGVLFRIDTSSLLDAQGRSVEEHGVIPDIIIDSGSCALETVLDLIQ